MTESNGLANAVGARLAELRQEQGISQDALAEKVRFAGLRWTRAMVASTEIGRRSITLDELLVLSIVLDTPPHALFPSYGPRVSLTSTLTIHPEGLQRLVRGEKVGFGPDGLHSPRVAKNIRAGLDRLKKDADLVEKWFPSTPVAVFAAIQRDSRGEAEQMAAKKLGFRPLAVAAIAHKTWGRGLTTERDRRVEQLKSKDATPRKLQALRGHITRSLLSELQEAVKQSRSLRGRR